MLIATLLLFVLPLIVGIWAMWFFIFRPMFEEQERAREYYRRERREREEQQRKELDTAQTGIIPGRPGQAINEGPGTWIPPMRSSHQQRPEDS